MKSKIKKKDMLIQAEKIVKDNPREFLLGFLSLGVLFFLTTTAIGYLFFQNSSIKINSFKQLEKKQQTTNNKQYHIMKKGESLWDVAQNYYGDPYLYPKIIELNKLSSPDFIEPGTKIRVK